MDRVGFAILLLFCKFPHAIGNQNVDSFVRDIVETFRYHSPTIIYDEYAPEICITRQWVLCVTNEPDKENNELADYFAMLTRTRVHTTDNRYIFNSNVDAASGILLLLGPRTKLELNLRPRGYHVYHLLA